MTGTRTASPITPLPQPSTKAVGALALFALALIILPVFALGVRVPFDRLGEILTSTDTRALLRVTLSSAAVSYTHLTLPTIHVECRSRWSPYH